ncbi:MULTISPECIES: META domain-containing protein [unclassified Halomonas]|uniref:META domain-containing protein n=1 Tax=unclassified Halomonas TaxID=2609666 RepID=UPI00138DEA02|nr:MULTISPECIES: META domain-containing protein [unclassified Halomonas]
MKPTPGTLRQSRLWGTAWLLLMMAGCTGASSSGTGSSESFQAEASSLAPLPASFRGELSCDDCKAVRLDLALDDGGRYLLKETHLGPGEQPRRRHRGQWQLTDGELSLGEPAPEAAQRWQVAQGGDLVSQASRTPDGASARLARLPEPLREPLEERYWKLVQVDGEVAVDGSAHIVLHTQEGRLAGSGGCNRLMGSYQREGDALSLAPLATTRKACQGPVMAQERALVEALGATRAFRLLADELELLDENDKVLARFEVVHLT